MLAVALGAFAIGAGPAMAQPSTPSRAFRGLFGANNTTTTNGQSLSLNVTIAEAYDDDVMSLGGPTLRADPVHGYYSLLSAGAEYAHRSENVQVGFSALSALRYDSGPGIVNTMSGGVAAGISTRLPGRGQWHLDQSVSYSPSYLYGLFPDGSTDSPGSLPPTSSQDYAANGNAAYAYQTSTGFTRGVSRRGSISASGDVVITDFLGRVSGPGDTKSYSVRAGYDHSLARNTVANLGYRFVGGNAGFAAGESTVEHGIEFGIETARPLSATRKATFALTVGPSTVLVPADAVVAGAVPTGGSERLFRFAGGLDAGYQFRRTWEARASYRRGLEYVAGIRAPVLTGAASASVSGLLSRRVDLSLSAGYSDGSSALLTTSTFTTYTADARLRYALTRSWALYTEYFYYFYDFSGTTLLAPGLPERLKRNAVRGGLTLWLPILKR